MKSSSFQAYKSGDIVFYNPLSLKHKKEKYKYILFLIELKYEDNWWCGWFDYFGCWRESLIPQKYMKKIND